MYFAQFRSFLLPQISMPVFLLSLTFSLVVVILVKSFQSSCHSSRHSIIFSSCIFLFQSFPSLLSSFILLFLSLLLLLFFLFFNLFVFYIALLVVSISLLVSSIHSSLLLSLGLASSLSHLSMFFELSQSNILLRFD